MAERRSGDGGPIAFYERYGFEQTGEIVFDNEVQLRLTLTELAPSRCVVGYMGLISWK
jgi:hypothetical protein